jgi:uncharacterized protein YciI
MNRSLQTTGKEQGIKMWYLVISRPLVSREEVVKHLQTRAHIEWQRQHHEDGIVLFSGPTSDRTAGIYVLRAKSLDEARAIVDTDPLHVDSIRAYEMFEWACGEILGAGFGSSGRSANTAT